MAQSTSENYPAMPVWSYSADSAGRVPGPEIHVKADEPERFCQQKDLPHTTAVHFHGIRIDGSMDEAAPLTQAPVPPGKTFNHDFFAPDPDTYWSHSHDRGSNNWHADWSGHWSSRIAHRGWASPARRPVR